MDPIKFKSIVLVANSSWYLFHYRSFLIKQSLKVHNIVAIAPADKFSSKLRSLCRLVNWKISKKNTLNILSLIKPFFSLLDNIKNIKPHIIHSHTLKPNLFVAIISYFLGIKTVLSFAGLGTLSKKNGFERKVLEIIIKIIYFFSTLEVKRLFFFSKNFSRTIFVFQNINDKKFFESLINMKEKYKHKQIKLIPGSGLPKNYQESSVSNFINNDFGNNKNYSFTFLYCARLLKSKGIIDFLKLSLYFQESLFYVYGEIDSNSKDSINERELLGFKKKYNNVRFMGFKSNPMFLHLHENPILIVPSNYGEGLPRAILEAISLGYPVIATKNSCAGNFNKNQVFITQSSNPISIKNEVLKIQELINKNKLKDFLLNSKFYIQKEFTEEIIVKKTIKIYSEIFEKLET